MLTLNGFNETMYGKNGAVASERVFQKEKFLYDFYHKKLL